MTRTAFSDCFDTIDDLIAEADKVVVRWTARGTHRGEWVTPLGTILPTGKRMAFTAIHIFRIADGKIAKRWAEADVLGLWQQGDALRAHQGQTGGSQQRLG